MKKILKTLGLSLVLILFITAGYYLIIRQLDQKVIDSKDFISAIESDSTFRIPSYFIDGERLYIKIPIKSGDTILGFCDTGGGISMLMPKTKEKLNLETKTGLLKGIMPMEYILFSDLVENVNFPKPNPTRNFILRSPFKRITSPYLIVPPKEGEVNFIIENMPEMEAFLAQGFFMNKSWTFDYPKKEVWVHTPLNDSILIYPNVQKIGFKKNINNDIAFGHPSMKIEIEGDFIDVLFDTGATIVLSESGRKEMKTNKKTLAGSFIAVSIYEKWKLEHPDWKYYKNADMSGDLVEVPIVKIGSFKVGPVLFAVRPDKNWSEGMIASMDKVVKGAIGGSALKSLKVTIDYNSEFILVR